MSFTPVEREYLLSQSLGRLATILPSGAPQNSPVTFVLNDDDTIDIGGPNNGASRKFRNARARPAVSFVVDDITPDDPSEVRPGNGRGVEIRAEAEVLVDHDPPMMPEFFSREVIRLHPRRVLSWHIDHANPDGVRRDFADLPG